MRENRSAVSSSFEPGLAAPRVYVDADACPVKDEVVKVARRHGLSVTFVSNGGLRPSRDPMIQNVVVGTGADAADDWIVERAGADDIVVTADILLAARALARGARVMGPGGTAFTQESIGMAVAMRALNQQLRETGAIRGTNPQFSARDRSRFTEALELVVRRVVRSRMGVTK